MFGEMLEYILTPASRLARRQGFLRGAIQIRSRHGRCRRAWGPHLEETRRVILEAAEGCRKRGRVLVLGGGLVHDVPVAELCAEFDEVVLVDMVHPLSSRLETLRFRNLRRLEWDVTGWMEGLGQGKIWGFGEPDLCCGEREVDLVVSVNVLSQIGWAPSRMLRGSCEEDRLESLLSILVRAHLDGLRRLPCASALVTDYKWRRREIQSGESAAWEVLHGVQLPAGGRRWEWEIAPAPEREKGADFTACVAGYADWKASGWEG